MEAPMNDELSFKMTPEDPYKKGFEQGFHVGSKVKEEFKEELRKKIRIWRRDPNNKNGAPGTIFENKEKANDFK